MTDEILEHVENKTVLMLVVELMNLSSSPFETNKQVAGLVIILFCNGSELVSDLQSESLYISLSFLITVASVTWYINIVSIIRLQDPCLIQWFPDVEFLFALSKAGVLNIRK